MKDREASRAWGSRGRRVGHDLATEQEQQRHFMIFSPAQGTETLTLATLRRTIPWN